MKKSSVIVYSTPFCPWCIRTKEFLKKNKIKFKDIDVSSNDKNVQEMISKSHQTGVPVIDINGSIIVGFEESKLKALLKIK